MIEPFEKTIATFGCYGPCLPFLPATYGAKYPEMSRIKCAGLEPKALTEPFAVGTIAMFEVMEPSMAFNVDTSGWVAP